MDRTTTPLALGPYLQVSVLTGTEPATFLADGHLYRLCKRIWSRSVGQGVLTVVNRSVDGRTVSSLPPEPLTAHFSLDDADSFGVTLERPGDKWTPPLFSVGVSTSSIPGYAYVVSWSILAGALSEQEYVSSCAEQFGELLAWDASCAGFAGPTPSPSAPWANSPAYDAAEMSPYAVDFARQVPGVHWLTLLPRELLGAPARQQLEALNVRLVDGTRSMLVELRVAPSQVTDELVRAATSAFGDTVHPACRRLPDDWWRTTYE